jgi:adenylate cyclase
MSFRTKLLLSLTLLVSISCVVAGGILYVQSRHFLFRELQSKVLSIAASGAAAVDGDLHRAIQSPGDEDTPEYRMLEAQLREIRDANRRTDVQVAFIYTVLYDPENPRVVRFGVDAEEDPAEKSYVGDIYEGRPGEPMIFAESQVDADFSVDRWGTWLSANAPIRDSSGAVVAALGVDVRAEDILLKLARIRLSLITAVGVSFALAVMLSLALAGRVSRPLLAVRNTVQRIGRGDLEARVYLKTRDEFGQVAAAINEMAKGLREREELKSAFARYVSQQVMEEILEKGGELSLKGVRKKVTVLFSDIRNFTTFAEGHTPEQVVGLLNEYFEAMIDVIFRNKGTLDKFMGDGLMVLFGAPLPDSEQEENAVRAALEMQRELSRLAIKWTREVAVDIRIGIGIHTGHAIVGNIGSTRRMEYTAIGDMVNLASRLETTTKTMGASILVSESTYLATRDRFTFLERGSITVKGRHEPVAVYSVDVDSPPADSRPRPDRDDAADPPPLGAT